MDEEAELGRTLRAKEPSAKGPDLAGEPPRSPLSQEPADQWPWQEELEPGYGAKASAALPPL